MLRDDMEQYTKLTGKDATNVPIIKLGAYLDGYDKGIEVLDKIRAEIIQSIQNGTLKIESGNEELFRIIDKYKAESEIHCTWTDSEIAKSFIEDVEAVKDLLPRAEGSDKV